MNWASQLLRDWACVCGDLNRALDETHIDVRTWIGYGFTKTPINMGFKGTQDFGKLVKLFDSTSMRTWIGISLCELRVHTSLGTSLRPRFISRTWPRIVGLWHGISWLEVEPGPQLVPSRIGSSLRWICGPRPHITYKRILVHNTYSEGAVKTHSS